MTFIQLRKCITPLGTHPSSNISLLNNDMSLYCKYMWLLKRNKAPKNPEMGGKVEIYSGEYFLTTWYYEDRWTKAFWSVKRWFSGCHGNFMLWKVQGTRGEGDIWGWEKRALNTSVWLHPRGMLTFNLFKDELERKKLKWRDWTNLLQVFSNYIFTASETVSLLWKYSFHVLIVGHNDDILNAILIMRTKLQKQCSCFIWLTLNNTIIVLLVQMKSIIFTIYSMCAHLGHYTVSGTSL